MNVKLVAGLAALSFAAPAIPEATVPPKPDPMINSGMPPVRFMGEAGAVVYFVNDVPSICGQATPPYVIIACASEEKRIIIMPNPCHPRFAGQEYAKIMCHEKSHLLGWPATHGA